MQPGDAVVIGAVVLLAMAAWFSWRIQERPQEPMDFGRGTAGPQLGSGRMALDLIIAISAILVIAAGVIAWWQPD
jgi:hypothetical protein